jgi:hypothetical protein
MRLIVTFVMLLPCLVGCQKLDESAAFGRLDEAYFRCEVQPLITKSCSTFRCHGTADRYYYFFARNRLRLGGAEDQRGATMRDPERAFNYSASAAQVDSDDPAQSQLLLKPLDQAAGGYYHGGAVEYGLGDVYLSRDEDDFKTLQAWVMGASADPSCVEPGSDQ